MAAVASLTLTVATTAHAGAPVYIPPPEPEPPPAPPAPPPAPVRYRLLVLDLKAVDVEKAAVETLQGFVVTGLAQYKELDIVSGDDVKNLVDLQATRASMGCSEDASCLADIADALGAQLVVFGNCGRLDNALVINLNLFDSTKAQSLGRVVVQADNAKALTKKLRPKLHELVGRFYTERGLTLPALAPEKEEAPVAQASDPGPWPWVIAGTGVVLLAGGAAAAVVGYLPMAAFQESKGKVTTLSAAFAEDKDPGHIEDAKAQQVSMLAARDQWNGFGVYLFDVGVPAASVGLVLTAVGLVWGLSSPSPSEDGVAAPVPAPAPAAPAAAGGAR